MEIKSKSKVFFKESPKPKQNWQSKPKTLCVIKDYVFIPREKILN